MSPKDLLALVVLAATWGGSFLFIRVAVPAYGPLPLAAARVGLAALVLWGGMRLLGRRIALGAHWRPLLVLGFLNAALPYALISAAELHLTASFAAMLNATIPLWSVAFGVFWLGERVTPGRAAGLVVGLAGVGVLVGWSPVAMTREVLLGVAAMLVATASYAASGVWVKQRLAGVPAPVAALGQQLGALAWLAIPAASQLPRVAPTLPATSALLALALLSTAGAYVLYFRLIATLGPTRMSTVAYLFPVFGSLWGVAFLGERVTAGMFAGFAIILASVLLVNDVRWPRPARRATAPAAGD